LIGLPKDRSNYVIVFAVPSYFTFKQLVLYFEGYIKNVKYIRLLSDGLSNRVMLFIKFNTQSFAENFYMEYNGKKFSNDNAEFCYVGFSKQDNSLNFEKSNLILAPSGMVELPSCINCLELLEASISGLLTVLCNHSFHCDCSTRWKNEINCVVCLSCSTKLNKCYNCGGEENLWICLICGLIGCSRYHNKHSQSHFLDTKHAFALELETQRVWDYISDNYVHKYSIFHIIVTYKIY